MNLPLAQALELLNRASAVIVDDEFVTFATIEMEAALDEPFLCVAKDDSGEGKVHFHAEDNATVEASGHVMTIVDTDGTSRTIALLAPFPAEKRAKSLELSIA